MVHVLSALGVLLVLTASPFLAQAEDIRLSESLVLSESGLRTALAAAEQWSLWPMKPLGWSVSDVELSRHRKDYVGGESGTRYFIVRFKAYSTYSAFCYMQVKPAERPDYLLLEHCQLDRVPVQNLFLKPQGVLIESR